MRRFGLIAGLVGGLLVGGCEAPPPAAPTDAFVSKHQSANATASSKAASLRHKLTGSDNGLEVRRLLINDRSDIILNALTSHADGQAADSDALRRLKRNGLRFVRVPLDRLDPCITDLGLASYDANEWHGQVLEWRSLLDRPIDESGRAVAVDGLLRRYERGDLRLMMRAWTVQMEDGPAMHLEMVPRRRLPQTNNLRKLLSEQALGGTGGEQAFPSMALDLQLQPGFAYVLISESPNVDWAGLDGDAGGAPQASVAAIQPKANVPRTGPFDDWNPAAPPTLGEFLLQVKRDPPHPPGRGILIFIPKIPSELL